MRKTIVFFFTSLIMAFSYSYGQSDPKVIAVWGFHSDSSEIAPANAIEVYNSISNVLLKICNPKAFSVRYTQAFINKMNSSSGLDLISFEPEVEELLNKLSKSKKINSDIETLRKKASNKHSKKFQADLIIFGNIYTDQFRRDLIINIVVLETDNFREKARETITIREIAMKKTGLRAILKTLLTLKLGDMDICLSTIEREQELIKYMSNLLNEYLIHYENEAQLKECWGEGTYLPSRNYKVFKEEILIYPVLVNIYYDNKINKLIEYDRTLTRKIRDLQKKNPQPSTSYANKMCGLLRCQSCLFSLIIDTAKEAKQNELLDHHYSSRFSQIISGCQEFLRGINPKIAIVCP